MPPTLLAQALAACYVLSGVCQPLIMTLCKEAGLANPKAQLYMCFYYAGPSLLLLHMLFHGNGKWPHKSTTLKAVGIAAFDVFAQVLNYTGATLAGPTIFAIVYSSVTVWTAVFSRFLLQRTMSWYQWLGIFVVFGGLVITASNSVNLGPDVMEGTLYVMLGSAMHALMYVLSESVMTGDLGLTALQNSAIQGLSAFTLLIVWQVVYTMPRFEKLITAPARVVETTLTRAVTIMLAFMFANLIHSYTFYSTIKHYPGGATSAGVMKGLQAALVFVFSHLVYCGRVGGSEMCFTKIKFVSLLTVVGGVVGFSIATERQQRRDGYTAVNAVSIEDKV